MANVDVFDAFAPSKRYAWFLLGMSDRTFLYLYHVDSTLQSGFSLLIQHRSFVYGPVLDIPTSFSPLSSLFKPTTLHPQDVRQEKKQRQGQSDQPKLGSASCQRSQWLVKCSSSYCTALAAECQLSANRQCGQWLVDPCSPYCTAFAAACQLSAEDPGTDWLDQKLSLRSKFSSQPRGRYPNATA
jgi:hypothetical protein